MAKESTDPNFLSYVKRYKKIFQTVCKKAKNLHNCEVINRNENKTKASWSIVNRELGIQRKIHGFPDFVIGNKLVTDGNQISNSFNNYF
jgi:hypothetical protein